MCTTVAYPNSVPTNGFAALTTGCSSLPQSNVASHTGTAADCIALCENTAGCAIGGYYAPIATPPFICALAGESCQHDRQFGALAGYTYFDTLCLDAAPQCEDSWKNYTNVG